MAVRSLLELILRSRKEGDAPRQVADDLKKVKREADGAGQKVEKLGAMSMKAKAGLLALAAGTVAFIGSAAMLAARVETLGVVTETLGRTAGLTEKEVRNLEEAIQDQGITTQASRLALSRMIQANIDLAHATDLARLAQDAAVIAGMNSSEAFEHLTNVIVTGNVRMGRTIGLQLQFGKALQNTAAQLGKNVDALTEEEIIQARTNEVLRQGVAIAGTYEAAMGTAGKTLTSMPRQIEEIKLAFGELFLPVLEAVVGKVYEAASALNSMMHFSDEVVDALEEHQDELMALGWGYDELVVEMERASDVAGKAGDAFIIMTRAEYLAETQTWSAAQEMDNYRDRLLATADAAGIAADASGDLAEANRDIALSLSDVTAASLAKEAMDKLNIAWEEGTITQEEYENIFKTVAGGMGVMDAAAIEAQLKLFDLNQEFSEGQVDLLGYITETRNLASELDLLPREIDIMINYYTGTIPTSPGDDVGYQHGGSFIVGGPPGPDNSFVAFRATRGERVDVTPRGQVGPGGGGGLNIYGDVVISGASGDPSAMVDEFLAELGRRQQQANASGMGYIGA